MTSLLYSDASDGRTAGVGKLTPMRQADVLGTLIDEGLASGRIVRFRATGTSMHPAIRNGESIAVAPVAAADVAPGAVLLCRHDARLLAHRVVAVATRDAERTFELRGDTLGASDRVVGERAVVGRVVGVWRGGRIVPIGAPPTRVDSVYHRVAMTIARAARALIARGGAR